MAACRRIAAFPPQSPLDKHSWPWTVYSTADARDRSSCACRRPPPANGLRADSAGGRIEVAPGCLPGYEKTRGFRVSLISQTERDIFPIVEAHMKFKGLLFFLVLPAIAADLPGSQDPPLMKRYAGSEIIGYRAPKFDEYLMPLGKPTSQDMRYS